MRWIHVVAESRIHQKGTYLAGLDKLMCDKFLKTYWRLEL